MSYTNKVPSVDDTKLLKSIKFPFQRGDTGFPASVTSVDTVFSKIVALIMTGFEERVMRNEIGVDVNSFVFENMTPIKKAMLSNMISSSIESFIKGVTVDKISFSDQEFKEGIGTFIYFDITYTYRGQRNSERVFYRQNVETGLGDIEEVS